MAALVGAIVASVLAAAVTPVGAQGESLVEWDGAPSCARDDTSGITAMVTNRTASRAGYVIEVRDRTTNRFIHGSHTQQADPGEALRVTLGGMPSGTWRLTMSENGRILPSSIMLMTFKDLNCVNQPSWFCDGFEATLVGTPGDDTLTGTNGFDVIVGREGNDTIRSLGGTDIVCAGKGDDVVFGGDGFDVLFGAQGNDALYASNGRSAADRKDSRGGRMFGGVGNDVIYGSDRWDRMQGGPGLDQLFGYEGRDWIRAGSGADVVDGGAGVDDLHGGNGNDSIAVTNGDSVRGGAGTDTCDISSGEASRLRSCELGRAGR